MENAYIYLRMILDRKKHPAGDEKAVGEMLMLTALGRDLEDPLGSKTGERLIEKWNSIVSWPRSIESDEVDDWVAWADLSLAILYMRHLVLHFGKLVKARLDAELVAETTLVEKAIENLGNYISKKLNEFPFTLIAEEKESVKEELFDLKKIVEEMGPLLEALQSAMHDELSETM